MTTDTKQQDRTGDVVAEEARKAGDSIRDEAQKLADEATDKGQEQAERQFEKGQNVVASQVDTLSSAIQDAAGTLTAEDHPLGHYTRELADSMSSLSNRISNSSLDELASDTRRLARENPALFLLGGIAVGVAASRFFKATQNRDASEHVGNEASSDGPGDRRAATHYSQADTFHDTGPEGTASGTTPEGRANAPDLTPPSQSGSATGSTGSTGTTAAAGATGTASTRGVSGTTGSAGFTGRSGTTGTSGTSSVGKSTASKDSSPVTASSKRTDTSNRIESEEA